ncbi:MAG TPA: hypothetical protein VK747_06180 [Blastocatellia bacterium]|nr:hypothetical protein [Blastocatellia bacterium]
MSTQETQVIFGARNPNFKIIEPDQLRVFEDIFRLAAVELAEPNMQVHIASPPIRTLQDGRRTRVMIGSHTEVNIRVRPHTQLRVESGNRPPLYQHGLYAGGAQQRNNFFQTAVVQRSLKRVNAILLSEAICGWKRSQVGIADSAPSQTTGP